MRFRLFDCCNPTSHGKPKYLGPHVRDRDPGNLISSVTPGLQLFYNIWEARSTCQAVVFIAHGELDHSLWYNGIANRLRQVGCTVVCHDVQGFGQSDGMRGYFESFDDIVNDFLHVVDLKWNDLCDSDPVLILLGFGFGALVAMASLPALREQMPMVQPLMVLIAPGVSFTSPNNEKDIGGCMPQGTACHSFPDAPIIVHQETLPKSARHNLKPISNWFPKIIVTDASSPDIISRDPQVMERWARDCLNNSVGYRARVLQEIKDAQNHVLELLDNTHACFADVPCLMLHGGQDSLYSSQGTQLLHASWCAISREDCLPFLKIYGGACHHLLHEVNKEEVFNDIVRFVSGASHI